MTSMGTRPKGEEPHKRESKPQRGPKPETLILPGHWEENVGKAHKKGPTEEDSAQPKKKGRGK
jgi:hypothetical protein